MLSHVQLFANPWVVVCQTLLSMGFSRQEYWSGLPCPPPGNLPIPGIKPRSPALQVNFLPSEPPGKPKNTGVGSLCLFQGIFPTQGSNLGLPHYRQILYHLSHQKVPNTIYVSISSVSSVTQSCPTLCDPMNRSMLGLPCPSLTPGVHSNSCPSSQ